MRHLVENGIWRVPVSERPTGWEKFPVREPTPKIIASSVPDIQRCLCGRTKSHPGTCTFRVIRKRVAREAWHIQNFRDAVIPAIAESAKAFGADEALEMSARVLFAGMYSRSVPELREITGASVEQIEEVATRCLEMELWKPNGIVVLGELDPKDGGDLEFWLNAMVAHGELRRAEDGKFGSKNSR